MSCLSCPVVLGLCGAVGGSLKAAAEALSNAKVALETTDQEGTTSSDARESWSAVRSAVVEIDEDLATPCCVFSTHGMDRGVFTLAFDKPGGLGPRDTLAYRRSGEALL